MRRRRWLRVGVAAGLLAAAAGIGAFAARRGWTGSPNAVSVAPTTAPSPAAMKRELADTPWELVTPRGGPAWARVSQLQIDEAKKLDVAVAFENPIGMRFVLIPAGKFVMGSPPSEAGRDADEPQREVTLASAFYLQTSEVTSAQFKRFRPDHQVRAWSGARVDMDELPVGDVTLDEVAAFATWAGADGRAYRLPTDEEWELACRAGTTTASYWGDRVEDAGRFANVCDLSAKSRWNDWRVANTTDGFPTASPTASFPANPWGLHDMIGNASELVRAEAGRCVTRGGNWASDPARFRSAARDVGTAADAQQPPFGFRLVAELPAK